MESVQSEKRRLKMNPLPSHQHVGAAFDHETHAAAMFIFIVQAMGLAAVDNYRVAALHGQPGVRPAALLMDPLVAHAQYRLTVHDDIRRARDGRANAGMSAAGQLVGIFRHQRLVTEAGERSHRFRVYTNHAKLEQKNYMLWPAGVTRG